MDQEKFLSRPEATHEANKRGLKLGKSYLAQTAHRGEGPPYHIAFGRAYYKKAAFVEWLEEKLSTPFNSTAAIEEFRLAADRIVRRYRRNAGVQP